MIESVSYCIKNTCKHILYIMETYTSTKQKHNMEVESKI